MSNYDLEEVKLLKAQMVLSVLAIVTVLVSLGLSYNEILKLNKTTPLFSRKMENDILISNRLLVLIISIGFLYIDYIDKNIKQKYKKNNLRDAQLQINASILSVIASIIVLYTAFDGENGEVELENPELQVSFYKDLHFLRICKET